ncbi:MAG: low-complexity protein, partial [Okeania sp. SIO2H7]|nr:low-complexity protein [Okeania sp. SIO2H7]
LLDYLQAQGLCTEEIQQKVIAQVIIKRARKDKTFWEQLLRWEKTAPEAARISMVGEAVRYAIAILWEQQ